MIRVAFIATTLSFIACAVPAYGQNDATGAQAAPAVSAALLTDNLSDVIKSGAGAYGNTQSENVSLTREEVKQQLAEAQRDGEITRLNQTDYKGQ